MYNLQSFQPAIDENSKILILGSMPGLKSLEMQQYYAHPQNRFWKIMASICKNNQLVMSDYNDKIKILLMYKIALWDTLKYCDRKGSLDYNIKNEIPNDIYGLLKKYPNINTICLNGLKSSNVFQKYFLDLKQQYKIFNFPSTSPANAKYSINDLLEKWIIAFQ
jgi:hypoxanthine-DNA glycosylase